MADAISEHNRYLDALARQIFQSRHCDYEGVIGDGWWCEATVRRGDGDAFTLSIESCHWRGEERTVAQLVAAIPDAAQKLAEQARYELGTVFARADAMGS